MKRIKLLLLIVFACSTTLQAQTVYNQVIDSISQSSLLTSDYMSYCQQGLFHAKSDEAHSLSLNYYVNPAQKDFYYIIGLSVVTPQKQEIRKGHRLKLVIEDKDTVMIKCMSNVVSEDLFSAEGPDSLWVVLPQYSISEKNLQRLLNEKVTGLWQELPGGKSIRLNQKDFHRWRFTETLKSIFKEINKQKRDTYDADLLFNNGQYKYITNDTIISTDRKITFSDEWMYGD